MRETRGWEGAAGHSATCAQRPFCETARMTIHQGRSRHNVPAARGLRGTQRRAETILWDALRNRRLSGLKFRRQNPIGPFVADFCCPNRRLVIEVDGDVHETQHEEDAAREALLTVAGYEVMRIPNEAVIADLPMVLAAIAAAADRKAPRSGTPPFRTGGL